MFPSTGFPKPRETHDFGGLVSDSECVDGVSSLLNREYIDVIFDSGSPKLEEIKSSLRVFGRIDAEEISKLAWTDPVTPEPFINAELRVGNSIKIHDLRFDFSGKRLMSTRGQDEYEEDTALYHHGLSPEQPGYTIPELVLLGQSRFNGQMRIALDTLKEILHQAYIQEEPVFGVGFQRFYKYLEKDIDFVSFLFHVLTRCSVNAKNDAMTEAICSLVSYYLSPSEASRIRKTKHESPCFSNDGVIVLLEDLQPWKNQAEKHTFVCDFAASLKIRAKFTVELTTMLVNILTINEPYSLSAIRCSIVNHILICLTKLSSDASLEITNLHSVFCLVNRWLARLHCPSIGESRPHKIKKRKNCQKVVKKKSWKLVQKICRYHIRRRFRNVWKFWRERTAENFLKFLYQNSKQRSYVSETRVYAGRLIVCFRWRKKVIFKCAFLRTSLTSLRYLQHIFTRSNTIKDLNALLEFVSPSLFEMNLFENTGKHCSLLTKRINIWQGIVWQLINSNMISTNSKSFVLKTLRIVFLYFRKEILFGQNTDESVTVLVRSLEVITLFLEREKDNNSIDISKLQNIIFCRTTFETILSWLENYLENQDEAVNCLVDVATMLQPTNELQRISIDKLKYGVNHKYSYLSMIVRCRFCSELCLFFVQSKVDIAAYFNQEILKRFFDVIEKLKDCLLNVFISREYYRTDKPARLVTVEELVRAQMTGSKESWPFSSEAERESEVQCFNLSCFEPARLLIEFAKWHLLTFSKKKTPTIGCLELIVIVGLCFGSEQPNIVAEFIRDKSEHSIKKKNGFDFFKQLVEIQHEIFWIKNYNDNIQNIVNIDFWTCRILYSSRGLPLYNPINPISFLFRGLLWTTNSSFTVKNLQIFTQSLELLDYVLGCHGENPLNNLFKICFSSKLSSRDFFMCMTAAFFQELCFEGNEIEKNKMSILMEKRTRTLNFYCHHLITRKMFEERSSLHQLSETQQVAILTFLHNWFLLIARWYQSGHLPARDGPEYVVQTKVEQFAHANPGNMGICEVREEYYVHRLSQLIRLFLSCVQNWENKYDFCCMETEIGFSSFSLPASIMYFLSIYMNEGCRNLLVEDAELLPLLALHLTYVDYKNNDAGKTVPSIVKNITNEPHSQHIHFTEISVLENLQLANMLGPLFSYIHVDQDKVNSEFFIDGLQRFILSCRETYMGIKQVASPIFVVAVLNIISSGGLDRLSIIAQKTTNKFLKSCLTTKQLR